MDILDQLNPQFIKDPHTEQNRFAFLPIEEYELLLKENETLQKRISEVESLKETIASQTCEIEQLTTQLEEISREKETVQIETIPQETVEEEEPEYELTLEL